MFGLNKQKRLDADLRSAIWIIASKDGRRIITYPGLYHRLIKNASFEKKNLEKIRKEEGYSQLVAVVSSLRELFRPGVSKKELDAWKADLRKYKLNNSVNYPEWLADIGDDDIENDIISFSMPEGPNELKCEDVFHSQFRVRKTDSEGSDAAKFPPSDIEIIKWGLDYIESLRTAEAAPGKKWREQLMIVIPLVIALLSLLVSVYTSWYSQDIAVGIKHEELNNATQLKKLEVNSHREGNYFAFMNDLDEAYDQAVSKNQEKWMSSLAKLDARWRLMATYSENQSVGEKLQSTYGKFVELGKDLFSRKTDEDKMASRFDALKGDFAKELAELWRGH